MELMTAQQAPMPLPMLPELKRKEEERRRGAYAVPNAPGAAPVQVAVIGTTPSSPLLWLGQTLLRTLMRNGLPDGTFYVGGVIAAGLTLGLAYGSMVREPAEPPMSAAFIPHPTPVGELARPIQTPAAQPSSLTMVAEPLPAPAAPAPEPAPAASPDAEPAAPQPAPEPAAAAPAAADRLQDAVASFKPRRGRDAGRMAWGGQTLERVAPAGGDFRPMRSPEAVRAAKAAAGRRNGRAALQRISARQRLSSSHLMAGSAQRAMGQLKLAAKVSAASSAGPTAETAKQGATNAFDQTASVGGEGLKLDAVPATGLGASAPDPTEASGAPAVPEGKNVTPYQDKVDSAKKKNSMTVVMLILGAVLLAAGIALVAFADQIAEFLGAAAATIKAIGYALIGAGTALILAGFMMAQSAKDDAKDVGDKYGQKDQQAVLEDCADQSLGKADCAPKAVAQPANTVHEAVETESKAGYTLGAPGAQGTAN